MDILALGQDRFNTACTSGLGRLQSDRGVPGLHCLQQGNCLLILDDKLYLEHNQDNYETTEHYYDVHALFSPAARRCSWRSAKSDAHSTASISWKPPSAIADLL